MSDEGTEYLTPVTPQNPEDIYITSGAIDIVANGFFGIIRVLGGHTNGDMRFNELPDHVLLAINHALAVIVGLSEEEVLDAMLTFQANQTRRFMSE